MLTPRVGFFVFVVLVCAAVSAVAAASVNYSNPVVGFDLPDPSIMRVGSDFYAAATTSEYLPAFPVLHSRDLVNWRLVSAVLPDGAAWADGAYWAPELCNDLNASGLILATYAAHHINGSMCVGVATAPHALGPYVDRGPLVCQFDGSIDSQALRDEHGALHLVWKEDGDSVGNLTRIWSQPLDSVIWQLTGARTQLLANEPLSWEGSVVEGPFVFYHRSSWFMLYSGNGCCGRGCAYAVGVARAPSLLGPWSKYAANPLMASNDAFYCPGHGTAVTLADGRMFFLFHAYSAGTWDAVGRQLMMQEIDWQSGWPALNNGSGPSASAPAPLGQASRHAYDAVFDNFTSPTLQLGWVWLVGSAPRVALGNAALLLAPPHASQSGPIAGVLAHYVATGDYVATAELDAASVAHGGLAGLAAFGSPQQAIGVGWQRKHVVLWVVDGGTFVELLRVPLVAASPHAVVLRMRARANAFFSFAVSTDGVLFVPVPWPPLNGVNLPMWDVGVRPSLTVGGVRNASAVFKSFTVNAQV